MLRTTVRGGLGAALGLLIALTPAARPADPKPADPKAAAQKADPKAAKADPKAGDKAADPKADTVTASPKAPAVDKVKAPDFAGYVNVTTITGEIVKADDKSATVRVYWQVATPRSTRSSRPSLYSTGRTHVNPYAVRRPSVTVHTEHHDYQLEYVPDSLVRTKTLPPNFDASGKKVPYTEAERAALRVPQSVVGYQAAKADLTPGTVVEVFVIRDKSIAAAKVTENDMRVKYAVILGQDPNPPKDIAAAKNGPSKNPPPKK